MTDLPLAPQLGADADGTPANRGDAPAPVRLAALPATCPGCGRAHTGDNVHAPLAFAAHRRAREMGGLPAGVVRAPDGPMELTFFVGGMKEATGGRVWRGTPDDLADRLREYGRRIVPKGSPIGEYLVDALLLGADQGTAYRADPGRPGNVLAVHTVTLDSDGVPGGDWHRLTEVARACGLAVVFNRSSSHRPEEPTWHATIQYATPMRGDDPGIPYDEWRRRHAWVVGFFSALAGSPGVGKHLGPEGKKSPCCGLDLKSKQGGRASPVFPGARRDQDAPPRETFATPGGALDLDAFLRLTGYPEARAAWVEREATPGRIVPISRTSTEAGEPGATLGQVRRRRSSGGGAPVEPVEIPPDMRDAVLGWAHAHGATYGACHNHNRAVLALSGALGRRGVAPGLVGEIVGQLVRRSGMRDAGARVRVAVQSAQRAARGEPCTGMRTLAQNVPQTEAGRAFVTATWDLLDVLAPDTEPEEPGPVVVEARRLPVVSHEERVAFQAGILTTPGRAGVDRSPTGSGKNHALAEVIARRFGRLEIRAPRERRPRWVVGFDSHDAADAFERMVGDAAARLGGRNPVARVPRQACEPEARGMARRYEAAARRGWNPIKAVCATCDHDPRHATGVDATPCRWRAAVREAGRADVVLTTKAQMSMRGFWSGSSRGGQFAAAVVDEDATDVLGASCELTGDDLEAFAQVVQATREAAERRLRDAQDAPGGGRAGAGDGGGGGDAGEASDLGDACGLVLDVLAALRRALEAGRGGREVEPVDGAPLLVEPWRRAKEGSQVTVAGAVEDRAVTVARRHTRDGKPPRNAMPLVEHIAGEQAAGRPVRVVVGQRGDVAILRLDLPRPVPAHVSMLVLDATADVPLLEAGLGRPVDVLESGTGQPVRVVQVTDSMWSRRRLGVARGERVDLAAPPPALVRLAGMLVALIVRSRAARVGVVSYAGLVDPRAGAPLVSMLRERLPGRVTVDALWFGACRGSNSMAGCDLVIVAGTPTPGDAWQVQRRALRLGGVQDDELLQEPGPLATEGDRGRGRFGYASRAMERARRSVVAAELAQAIGRGARGDQVPRAGVWVFSSLDLAGFVAVPIERVRAAGVCLDPEGAAAWDAVVGVLAADPGAGRDVIARAAGLPWRTARRVADAVRWGWATVSLDSVGQETGSVDAAAGCGLWQVTTFQEDVSLESGQVAAHPPSAQVALDPAILVPELESIRRWLGWSGRAFADALGAPRTSVRRWLAGSPAPAQVVEQARGILDREARAFTVAIGPDLLRLGSAPVTPVHRSAG